MYALTRLAGYAILLVTPAALLARALFAGDVSAIGDVSARGHVSAILVGLGGSLVLAGVAVAAERERALGVPEAPEFDRGDAFDALAVVAGAVVTYLLSVHAGLGPVVASALVGLLAGVFAREIAVPAYCGSFVGMASPALFSSVGYPAMAGLVSGLAFVAAEDAFEGVGGKLGTLALFGCLTTAALTGADYAAGSALPWTDAGLLVPVAVAGAVGTVILSVRFELGAVVGSAVVGLVAGLGFPAIAFESSGTLAAAAFCASFVGMSSSERLDGEVQVALAGAVSGLVFVAVATAFAGAGGKLGTIAFVACVTVVGVEEIFAITKRPLDN